MIKRRSEKIENKKEIEQKWTLNDEIILGKIEKNTDNSIEKTFEIINVINKKLEDNLKIVDYIDALEDLKEKTNKKGKEFLIKGDFEAAKENAQRVICVNNEIKEKMLEIEKNTKILNIANKELENNLIGTNFLVNSSILGNLVKEERTDGVLKQWTKELKQKNL